MEGGLGIQLSRGALTWHVPVPRFHPSSEHCRKEIKDTNGKSEESSPVGPSNYYSALCLLAMNKLNYSV